MLSAAHVRPGVAKKNPRLRHARFFPRKKLSVSEAGKTCIPLPQPEVTQHDDDDDEEEAGGTVPSSERRDVTDEVLPYRTAGEPSEIYSGVFPCHKGQAYLSPFSRVDTAPAALRMVRAAPETGG